MGLGFEKNKAVRFRCDLNDQPQVGIIFLCAQDVHVRIFGRVPFVEARGIFFGGGGLAYFSTFSVQRTWSVVSEIIRRPGL